MAPWNRGYNLLDLVHSAAPVTISCLTKADMDYRKAGGWLYLSVDRMSGGLVDGNLVSGPEGPQRRLAPAARLPTQRALALDGTGRAAAAPSSASRLYSSVGRQLAKDNRDRVWRRT